MVKFTCPECAYVMQTAQYLNGLGHCLKCDVVVAKVYEHPLNPEWTKKIKARFDKLNTDGKVNKNGYGTLDFDEMCTLLKKGNPNMSDTELKVIFDGADANHNGFVDFEEFLWFLYAGDDAKAPAAAPTNSSGAPPGVVQMFVAYAGKGGELDGTEFGKMIKESGLFDKKFTKNDVDMIFAKILSKIKPKRKIDCDNFIKCLNEIATKKGVDVEAVFSKIGAMSGPVNSGTKADNVRLNDDKSTFTGAHATGGKHGAAGSQDVRVANQGPSELDTNTDWSSCESTFRAFAGKDASLDQREFTKMMKDCGIVGRTFDANACDLVFTKVVPKGHRMTDFEQFANGCRHIGKDSGQPCDDIRDKIASSSGPIITGTQAEAVRLNDDKSTYTGAHKGK